MADGFGYNERIFESGGLRSFLHLARFRWLREKVAKYRDGQPPASVIELGCFDGKAIDYLPHGRPAAYLGLDANWEGGLDLARKRWREMPAYSFLECSRVADFQVAPATRFDCAISMETLEHLPPEDLEAYLEIIARHLDGHFFVTVPNEKGPLFFLKWLGKRLLTKDGEHYTAAEVFWATVGRSDKVRRDQHKGFDWGALVKTMKRHFDVIEVSGHPLRLLPTWACFSVGIVARSRASKALPPAR
jgi:hypothetical protein